MDLTIQPLSTRNWPLFHDLMTETGPAARCWCMYWRIGAGYRRRTAEQNCVELHRITAQDASPGLLACAGDLAVGWCQLTPRTDLPAIDRMWRLRAPDDVPSWAITCITVRKAYRRHGVTAELIAAAVRHAREAGAPAVDAYPFDAAVSPSATGTGYASTFERAGFTVLERRDPARPIMRLDL